jgi:hypothetical protein
MASGLVTIKPTTWNTGFNFKRVQSQSEVGIRAHGQSKRTPFLIQLGLAWLPINHLSDLLALIDAKSMSPYSRLVMQYRCPQSPTGQFAHVTGQFTFPAENIAPNLLYVLK